MQGGRLRIEGESLDTSKVSCGSKTKKRMELLLPFFFFFLCKYYFFDLIKLYFFIRLLGLV